MNNSEITTLQDFLTRLLHREQELNPEHVDQSLVFADALLLHAFAKPHLPELPPQIAVIGPTQSGKSSVVNLLLNHNAATASPLAGFTRHAQGFINRPVDTSIQAGTNSLLPALIFTPQEELSNDNIYQYSLTQVTTRTAEAPRITWDSPDFDSVSSRSYRSTVPMLCAVSDVIIMVVSREKYADQSVWEILRLFAPIGRPTILCINKTQAEARTELIATIEKKLASENLENIQVFTLPYLHNENKGHLADTPAAEDLRQEIDTLIDGRINHPSTGSLESFIQQHWSQWTAPAEQEVAALQTWHELVKAAMSESAEFYEAEYLNEPRHKDTIQQAMVKLLTLLEVPVIAGPLGSIRNAITWPVRQLGSFIKKQPDFDAEPATNPEQQIIDQALRHSLLTLSQEVGSRATSGSAASRHWWLALLTELNQQHHPLEDCFEKHITTHQEAFLPQIDEAAEKLYEHLEEHPMTLNGLRAARVTSDAAAVVLALKSGGIGVHDLVLTPAMLAFSSLLTEGALGQYMATVEETLKKAQLVSVKEHVTAPLEIQLQALATNMDTKSLYNISPDALHKANQIVESFS